MCLGIPGLIQSLEEGAGGMPMATVDFGGVRQSVCLAFTPEAVVGQYVLVHVGFALAVIDADEAARTLEILSAIGQSEPEAAGEVRGPSE